MQKSTAEAASNQAEIEKKTEEIRTLEQNIRILESGGEVQDQADTLQKKLDGVKIDRSTTQAKMKSLMNEIRRAEENKAQTTRDLQERKADENQKEGRKAKTQ